MIIGISGKIGSGKDTVASMIQYLDLKSINGYPSMTFEQFTRLTNYKDSQWKIKRFADTLKDITCMLIGCTREQLEDRQFKEAPLGEEWRVWYKQGNVMHYDSTHKKLRKGRLHVTRQEAEADILGKPQNHDLFDVEVVSKVLTPRKLMQLLGTEAGREIIHPNIWVNALFADYQPTVYGDTAKGRGVGGQLLTSEYPNWIIPDTRFENEAKAIRDRNGILIRINRIKDPREDMIGTDLSTWKAPSSHPSETALDKWKDWDYIIKNDGTLEDLLVKVEEIYNQINT